MFQPVQVISDGPYKITNLSCNLSFLEIDNQQTYGFTTDVKMIYVNVNQSDVNLNWQVLKPNSTEQANLNDGIFAYFKVELLDKNNNLVRVLNPSLKQPFFYFDDSSLSSLSIGLYNDVNYLRNSRIAVTSYTYDGKISKAVFVLEYKTSNFSNVEIRLGGSIFVSYDLENRDSVSSIAIQKSAFDTFDYIQDEISIENGSSISYPANTEEKKFYRLVTTDYYNTGGFYNLGQIKLDPLNTDLFDLKPKNITGAIIVNYDTVSDTFERFLFVKWAKNLSNAEVDYEIYLNKSGVSQPSNVFFYNAPKISNIDSIVQNTGSNLISYSQVGINPYYSGNNYIPVFSPSGESGIQWIPHTLFTDDRGSFPQGVYPTGALDGLDKFTFNSGSINSNKIYLNYYYDTGSGSFIFSLPNISSENCSYDSGYFNGYVAGTGVSGTGVSFFTDYTGVLVAQRLDFTFPSGSIVVAQNEPCFYIPISVAANYEVKVRGIVAEGVYTDFSDIVRFSQSGISAATTGVYDPATGAGLSYFTEDLIVSIASGKTFGKYLNGDVIPASGKTVQEVITMALRENLDVSTSLTSSSSVAFNQTAISNALNFDYTINTLGASVSGVSLEFRRGNVGAWSVLSTTTTTPSSYTHSLTDSNYNTSGFNYRYIVTDTAGASGVSLLTITPSSYSAPTASLTVDGINLISPETNSKREKGHINSTLGGTITRNSANVNLISYQWQYQTNEANPFVDIGVPVSIGPGTTSIISTGHNDSSLKAESTLSYRVKIIDDYQNYLSSQVYSSTSTVNFLNLIFYGPTSSTPTTSSNVRSLPSRIFTDGSNPFILNTNTTEKIFSAAMPSSLSLSQVLDLDALNANITANYAQSSVSVANYTGDTSSYNVYTMTNAVPYGSNHRHQITRA